MKMVIAKRSVINFTQKDVDNINLCRDYYYRTYGQIACNADIIRDALDNYAISLRISGGIKDEI